MAYNLFIAYDLVKPGQNYEQVRACIEALGQFSHVQGSVYYVHTSLTAEQATARISPVLDRNDKLVVVAATEARWVGYTGKLLAAVNDIWFKAA